MSKTTRVARPALLHLLPRTETDRTRLSTPCFIGAVASFAAACALGGGACSIALGNPSPDDLPRMAALLGALAWAAGLIGAGLLLALRQRELRKGEARLTSRAERIRCELDALGLTPRETTIAELILQHRSYDDIAERCHLSPRTVQFHASNIFRKAYVTRRREFERLMLVDDRSPEPYERISRIRSDKADNPGNPQAPLK
ncbi:helix-turn-helix transcriptional regulator [Eggerthellaceae bacterium 24-137]